jgi:integrase
VLLRFAAENGIGDIGDINQRALDRLGARLLDEGGPRGKLSRHSVHAYLRSVNHFLAWARREGELASDVKAATPRLPRHLFDALSREEIQRMEDRAPTERDRLIVRLLADTGIRVGELLGLRPDDLQEHGRVFQIRVRGKGDKDRLISIQHGLYRRVKTYATRGRPVDVETDRVFIGIRRRPGGGYRALTKSGVEQLIRLLARQAGIERRVWPHLLRHSYATWALRKGMNPLQLQQILGHSTLDMIANVYSHLNQTDAHEAQMRLLTSIDR